VITGEATIRKSLQIVIFGGFPSLYFCKKSKQTIMGLLSKIFNNTKKPEGFFGKLMVTAKK
jgi:hypothetical protein